MPSSESSSDYCQVSPTRTIRSVGQLAHAILHEADIVCELVVAHVHRARLQVSGSCTAALLI